METTISFNDVCSPFAPMLAFLFRLDPTVVVLVDEGAYELFYFRLNFEPRS
jgi:hypothetical protein